MIIKEMVIIKSYLKFFQLFDSLNNIGTLKGEPGSLYWQIWANYYVKFFQSYAENKIKFWGVTAQNEPTDGYIYKFRYSTCFFFKLLSSSWLNLFVLI